MIRIAKGLARLSYSALVIYLGFVLVCNVLAGTPLLVPGAFLMTLVVFFLLF